MREKEEVKKKKKKRDHIRIKNDLHTIKYVSKRLQLYKAHFHINFIITIVSIYARLLCVFNSLSFSFTSSATGFKKCSHDTHSSRWR